jgi:putative ABC transport system permease protein
MTAPKYYPNAVLPAASWRLAWQLLRREWRAGDVRLLFAALLLATSVVAGLSAFSSRLHTMLGGEAAQMLAADRVLESPDSIDPDWLQWAKSVGAKQSRFLTFQSMLYAKGQPPLLVSAKAADTGYPLLGKLQWQSHLAGPIQTDTTGPKPGQVWLETRAMQQLALQVGDTIELGDGQFKISGVLLAEPDRAAGFSGLGPRLLMHWDDIEKTGVVQPGSRITYRYLFTATADVLSQLDQHFKPLVADNQQWLDIHSAQPLMGSALDKAQQFLLLASAMVVVLAGIATALSSARFAQRQMHLVAILKTLGAATAQIQGLFVRILLILGGTAATIGCALAWGLQAWALVQAQKDLQVPIPALSAWPFMLGILVVSISLLAFVAPAFAELKKVSALSLLQTRLQSLRYFSWRYLAWALLGLGLLLAAYTRTPLLALLLILALLLLLACISLPTKWFLSRALRPQMRLQGAWALARSHLLRRLGSHAVYIALFSISAMLLLVLSGLQNQLFGQWQAQLPARTPNYFVINVPESQLPAAHQWLQARGLAAAQGMYPMVRARLTHINGVALRQRVSKDDAEQAGVNRELNLSWAQDLPAHNTLTAGQWWTTQNRSHGVSVESKLAKRLNIQLGDELQFLQGANTFSARVSSLRQVDWNRMEPAFYMLFTPEQLWDYPKTYMTSFYLEPAQQHLIQDWSLAFPQAIVLDLQAMIGQIRSIMARVAMALNGVLVLVLIGSALVLFSTVQHSLAERQHENAVLRAIGVSRRLLQRALLLEFAALGFMSGLLASVFAQIVLLALQHWVFDLPMLLTPQLWWPAPLLGALLIGTTGAISAGQSLRGSPLQVLRLG